MSGMGRRSRTGQYFRVARGGKRRLAIESLEARYLLSVMSNRRGEIPAELAEGLARSLTTTGSAGEHHYLAATRVLAAEFDPLTSQSGPLIQLDDFLAAPEFAGVDGSGFAAVVIDTGIDLDHPFFGPDNDSNGVSDRIVFSYDFAGTNDSNASDFNDHGSNVTSIVASSDPGTPGMAPGVDIIHLKVFPDGGGGASTLDIEEALQWVVANAATYNIASVNLSLGSANVGFHENELALSDEYAALETLDIVTAVASGNAFFSVSSEQGVNRLAADPSVLSVGAVYDANIGSVSYGGGAVANTTAANRITPFSQRDEFLLDVMAPGAAIRGANRNGGTVTMHGTSQAAPHIAGIAVLAQDLATQTLGRRLRLDEFKSLLDQSGVTVNDGDDENDNVVNTGLDFARVDVLALAHAILAMSPAGIEGRVFDDRNGNGIDDSEPGLASWTVYLDDNGNSALDAGTATFASITPIGLPDTDTASSSLDVVGLPGRITDVNAQLNITHSFVANLQAYLISPSGTRVELFADVGGGGNNFTDTVLDDEAAGSIAAGSTPFLGAFRPSESLSLLDGEDPNGEWRLEISDDASLDTGTLNSWSLSIEHAEQSQVTSAEGEYSFADLPAGDYQVRQILQPLFAQTAPTAPDHHAVSLNPGELVGGQNFGNRSDLVLVAATANGGNEIALTYEIVGLAGVPFEVGVYRSGDDVLSGADTLVDTLVVSDPGDLTNGLHTRLFAIGADAGEFALPGLGVADPNADYRLLVVVDHLDAIAESDANPTAEDNTQSLVGVYHAAGGPVMVFGNDAHEVLHVTISAANLQVQAAGTSHSYPAHDVVAVRVRGLGGNDSLRAVGVPKPMAFWGGSGNDTLTGGNADDLLDGGTGDDTYRFDADVSLGSDTISDSAGLDTLNFAPTTGQGVSVDLSLTTLQLVHPNHSLTLTDGNQIESAVGTSKVDRLAGNSLSNRLTGGGGDDVLIGRAGDDSYLFDADAPLGTDTLVENPGEGRDALLFQSTTSIGIALDLNLESQTVNTNLDIVLNPSDFESVSGTPLDDTLLGNSLGNSLHGLAGADRLDGRGGNDTLIGAAGNDTLIGAAGNDLLRGGTGDDEYRFQADLAGGSDTLIEKASEGSDWLDFAETVVGGVTLNLGSTAAQVVSPQLTLRLSSITTFENVAGTHAADIIQGNASNNFLVGLGGDDQLSGLDARDLLFGGLGTDTLFGGGDDDLLVGGTTVHELNRVALSSIADEWLSADGYASRTANLRATLLISGTTVLDDAENDTIGGDADRDWFFAQPGEVLDLAADEELDS